MAIWEVSIADFLLVTLFLGGGAAYLTGRATAIGWNSWLALLAYVLLLVFATRFIHFSLFRGSFFLPPSTFGTALYYSAIDFLVLMGMAALGRQTTRARQMSRQYHFLYDRAGPLGWRERTGN